MDDAPRRPHRERMNGRHGGPMSVLALMHLRGVTPDFRMKARKYGPRRLQRADCSRVGSTLRERVELVEH